MKTSFEQSLPHLHIRSRSRLAYFRPGVSALVILCSALLYLLTQSMRFDLNGIVEATAIEAGGRALFPPNHLLFRPVGFLLYGVLRLFGYGGRSIFPLQVLTAACGALGLGFAYVFYRQVIKEARSALASVIWLGTSWTYWVYGTDVSYIIPAAMLVAGTLAWLTTHQFSPTTCLALGVVSALTILTWQANIFLVPTIVLGLWLTQTTASRRQRGLFIGITLAALSLVLGGVYLTVGLFSAAEKSPQGLWYWLTRYSSPLPMWGDFTIIRVPLVIESAIASLVPLWSGAGLRQLLQGSITIEKVPIQLALLACLVLLIWPLCYLRSRWLRYLPARMSAWMGLAYCLYLPFIVWWDPFEPKWFAIPNLFLGAILGLAWANLSAQRRHRVLLFSCVLIIAAANGLSTIWPRHRDGGPFLQRAGCVVEHMGEADLLVATDWDWPGYVSYFSQKQLLNVIDMSTRLQGHDALTAYITQEVERVHSVGGQVYIIDFDAYPQSHRDWLAVQTRFSEHDLLQFERQQAFRCGQVGFDTLSYPRTTP